jgi:hypothetical protein
VEETEMPVWPDSVCRFARDNHSSLEFTNVIFCPATFVQDYNGPSMFTRRLFGVGETLHADSVRLVTTT